MYHNREVSLNSSISPHFLLARFAFVSGMFGTSEKRLVRVKVKKGGIAECDSELGGRSIAEKAERKTLGPRKERMMTKRILKHRLPSLKRSQRRPGTQTGQ
jgi:hypothetical protein